MQYTKMSVLEWLKIKTNQSQRFTITNSTPKIISQNQNSDTDIDLQR